MRKGNSNIGAVVAVLFLCILCIYVVVPFLVSCFRSVESDEVVGKEVRKVVLGRVVGNDAIDYDADKYATYRLTFKVRGICQILSPSENGVFGRVVIMSHKRSCDSDLPCRYQIIENRRKVVLYPCFYSFGRILVVKLQFSVRKDKISADLAIIDDIYELKRVSPFGYRLLNDRNRVFWAY